MGIITIAKLLIVYTERVSILVEQSPSSLATLRIPTSFSVAHVDLY